MAFSTDDVAVTLKGEQWFAILARLNALATAHPTPLEPFFSRKGARAYRDGMAKLQEQLLAVSASPSRKPKAKPDAGPTGV